MKEGESVFCVLDGEPSPFWKGKQGKAAITIGMKGSSDNGFLCHFISIV